MIELNDMQTSSGNTVESLSKQRHVLLVFLRQLGCMFCREAMTTLGNIKSDIEASGVTIVLVHMAPSDKKARNVLKKYKLESCELIADAECLYYSRFGLVKSSFSQLFGFATWAKTVEYGVAKGHGFNLPIGDGFQLPGMFMIRDGEIIESSLGKDVYEQPEYESFIQCCVPYSPK